jgi:hypothetical protein
MMALSSQALDAATPAAWNGGFEAPGAQPGKAVPQWSVWGGKFLICNEAPRSGNFCARLVHPQNSWTWFGVEPAEVKPASRCVFSLAYRSARPFHLTAIFSLWRDREKKSPSLLQRWYLPLRGVPWRTDSQWHTAQRVLAVPPDTKFISLSLGCSGEPATVDLDDLCFVPISEAPPGIITNLASPLKPRAGTPTRGRSHSRSCPIR